MKPILLILALTISMQAEDLWVFERDLTKHSAIYRGLANGVPVKIQVYGTESVQEAQKWGKSEADTRKPLQSAAAAIQATAERLYPGKPRLQRWFLQDASAEYDRERTRIGSKG